MNYDELTADKP